jgi:hypothetical protein
VQPLSIHQRKIISQGADHLPPSQRGDFIQCVARRLSKCIRYSDRDVSRACQLALRALERAAAA